MVRMFPVIVKSASRQILCPFDHHRMSGVIARYDFQLPASRWGSERRRGNSDFLDRGNETSISIVSFIATPGRHSQL
jgi:hypothetical protein